MKKATCAALVALTLTACAGLEQHPRSKASIIDSGMACQGKEDAARHEELRTKADATPYEVAAAMKAPRCIMVSQVGREVWVDEDVSDNKFVRVEPTGSGAWYWVPYRMVSWFH